MPGLGGESYQTPYGNFSNFNDLLDHLARTHQARGPPPASKTFVERLPVVTISEKDVQENADCSVCKDTFSLDDTALKLPCNHLFHSGTQSILRKTNAQQIAYHLGLHNITLVQYVDTNYLSTILNTKNLESNEWPTAKFKKMKF